MTTPFAHLRWLGFIGSVIVVFGCAPSGPDLGAPTWQAITIEYVAEVGRDASGVTAQRRTWSSHDPAVLRRLQSAYHENARTALTTSFESITNKITILCSNGERWVLHFKSADSAVLYRDGSRQPSFYLGLSAGLYTEVVEVISEESGEHVELAYTDPVAVQ